MGKLNFFIKSCYISSIRVNIYPYFWGIHFNNYIIYDTKLCNRGDKSNSFC